MVTTCQIQCASSSSRLQCETESRLPQPSVLRCLDHQTERRRRAVHAKGHASDLDDRRGTRGEQRRKYPGTNKVINRPIERRIRSWRFYQFLSFNCESGCDSIKASKQPRLRISIIL